MRASVDLLQGRREELSERAQIALDLLTDDIGRFEQLVTDLLEISRFDAGAQRLELEDVNIAEVVLQAVNEHTDTPIDVQVPSDLLGCIIPADKRRVHQVLANLIRNAEKHAGGATLVALEHEPDSVRIVIEDAGPGIDVSERELIFDRFSRGSSAGNRGSDDGVGLGLSLVSEHVALHGGRVWVEDRRNGACGSRFVVELPTNQP